MLLEGRTLSPKGLLLPVPCTDGKHDLCRRRVCQVMFYGLGAHREVRLEKPPVLVLKSFPLCISHV